MPEKVGVFLCRCGPNIGDLVDLDAVADRVRDAEGVASVNFHDLICSEEGLEFLKEEIRKDGLTRVVIAACTPKMYEKKLMAACRDAGLNPYLMQMANIREQCAWTITDRGLATNKAKSLVKAALERVLRQEPIDKKEIDVCPDVLVVGAGVAGVEASLTLAQQKKRKVVLVEKSPCLGGLITRFEEVYPTMECAPCMVAGELQDVLDRPNIDVMTYSEVLECVGSFGNFTVKVREKARYVSPEACIGCDACYDPCPVELESEYEEGLATRKAIYVPMKGALPNVPVIDEEQCRRLKGESCTACEDICVFGAINFEDREKIHELKVGAVVLGVGSSLYDLEQCEALGYGKHENVLSALQLERLNAENGPTGGKILMKNGKEPDSIAFVYCVGRKESGYCSGICCSTSLKLAHVVMKKLPAVRIHNFVTELCLPKKQSQHLYDEVSAGGVQFIKCDDIGGIKVDRDGSGKLIVEHAGKPQDAKVSVDMVVLVPAVVPGRDIAAMAGIFGIETDDRGFFSEEHALKHPFASTLEGVFTVGSCQGPKDIADAVSQGGAATGRILSKLSLGEKLELEPAVAFIDADLCGGCNTCIALCPYSAVTRDTQERVSVVDETLCRGCGTCVAACPAGAATARHFTVSQIFAEIGGLLK
ncbi:MAG: CoB--CoM heterodisulfide reductase iron-sulfur subunit A family protein [Pseudomonadota bacterium]